MCSLSILSSVVIWSCCVDHFYHYRALYFCFWMIMFSILLTILFSFRKFDSSSIHQEFWAQIFVSINIFSIVKSHSPMIVSTIWIYLHDSNFYLINFYYWGSSFPMKIHKTVLWNSLCLKGSASFFQNWIHLKT